jgi:hypothetical protein
LQGDEFSTLQGKIRHDAAWIMAGKRLYLLTRRGGLLYSPNPVVALAHHMRAQH